MMIVRDIEGPRPPTSESFAELSDRVRMPGRFFYRFVASDGRLRG